MAQGSDVTVTMHASEVPVMPEALEMYQRGVTTGANTENRALIENHVSFASSISMQQQELLVDPQTSGGLLLSLSKEEAKGLLERLNDVGIDDASIVGEVSASDEHALKFV